MKSEENVVCRKRTAGYGLPTRVKSQDAGLSENHSTFFSTRGWAEYTEKHGDLPYKIVDNIYQGLAGFQSGDKMENRVI